VTCPKKARFEFNVRVTCVGVCMWFCKYIVKCVRKFIMFLLAVLDYMHVYVLGFHLRSVDLTNFIYITDASMEYIGHITAYVFLMSQLSAVCVLKMAVAVCGMCHEETSTLTVANTVCETA